MSAAVVSAVPAAMLALPGGAWASEKASGGAEPRSVSLSLDGSSERFGDSRTDELRAGTEIELADELELGGSAFDLSLEPYYDYSRSSGENESTNVNSVGMDLARLMLRRWGKEELETLKPYLLGGLELSWLKETNDGERTFSNFLSPTLGLGMQVKLTSRSGLNLEYRQNLSRGDRRLSSFTVGFSYAIFSTEEGTDTE